MSSVMFGSRGRSGGGEGARNFQVLIALCAKRSTNRNSIAGGEGEVSRLKGTVVRISSLSPDAM